MPKLRDPDAITRLHIRIPAKYHMMLKLMSVDRDETIQNLLTEILDKTWKTNDKYRKATNNYYKNTD